MLISDETFAAEFCILYLCTLNDAIVEKESIYRTEKPESHLATWQYTFKHFFQLQKTIVTKFGSMGLSFVLSKIGICFWCCKFYWWLHQSFYKDGIKKISFFFVSEAIFRFACFFSWILISSFNSLLAISKSDLLCHMSVLICNRFFVFWITNEKSHL